MAGSIVILGVFVADTAYRAERAPRRGETIIGALSDKPEPAWPSGGTS
jgi:hypothetical protein